MMMQDVMTRNVDKNLPMIFSKLCVGLSSFSFLWSFGFSVDEEVSLTGKDKHEIINTEIKMRKIFKFLIFHVYSR